MSKRNFILLIIILAVVTAIVLGYLYFYQPTSAPRETGEGTNFLSQFNPFSGGGTTTNPPDVTPPVDISNPEPEDGTPEIVMLKKISSMPIAGYGIFKKERFKEVPIVTPVTPATTSTIVTTDSASVTTPPSPQSGASSTTTTTVTTISTKPTPPPTEFISALRYVARVNGNIYQTFADKIDERRFSSMVIPKVYEAYVGNRGESVIMRYLKSDGDNVIETFVGNLPKEVLGGDSSEDNQIRGSFLPQNIQDISISPDNSKIFYLTNIGENTVGTTLNLLDNKKVQIFDSPFTEWLSWWPNAKTVTLTTKPSASVPGYMYTVNTDTKTLSQTIGGINGLTTLTSPDTRSVLYSANDLSLSVYNVAAKSSTATGLRTLPEKCVWNRASSVIYCAVPKSLGAVSYPDAWYKGQVSFSDQIWKIDILTGTTTMTLDPASISGVGEIDGIKLGLDEDEKYLFFVNKVDSYLWELGL
jgi:hypothetical protein